MPESSLIRRLLLPELHLTNSSYAPSSSRTHLEVEKVSPFEVCPRCANPSQSVYDRRTAVVKDAPLREKHVVLHIKKRRFFCRPCGRPFTEPVPGIKKGARTTQRYKRSLLWACEKFSDLSSVRKAYACSSGFLYKALYAQLELERRKRLYPWPSVVGIDEHYFKRNQRLGIREFASVLVDFKGKRVMEVVKGRSIAELEASLAHIPGRENVRFVVLDLCEPFRIFARSFFPHAKQVADKFHVLRLLTPAINRYRKAITGDRRSLPVRKLLLRNGRDLDSYRRFALRFWLSKHPNLRQLYEFKECLHSFYRIRGPGRAARALITLTDRMALSTLPEIHTLRRTLLKWKDEILAYFFTRLTNGRTEGFNNKAKLVKRRAYGLFMTPILS